MLNALQKRMKRAPLSNALISSAPQVTGEVVSSEELGGPGAHMHYSWVVHFVAENDFEAISFGLSFQIHTFRADCSLIADENAMPVPWTK